MNKTISARFESYQHLLKESYAASRFVITKQRIYSNRGHIRLKIILTNGGLLEFSEHLIMSYHSIAKRKYSFHWQDDQQRLIQRWDNAQHHLHLSHAPHHVHQTDGTIEGNQNPPTLSSILFTIERQILLKQRNELRTDLDQFEHQYALESSEFCEKFKSGAMGDDMDFFEWYGAWRMYQNTLRSLKILDPTE